MLIHPVTVWKKFNDTTLQWEHNHITDGWALFDAPIPMFDTQKSWLNSLWRREYQYLVDGKIVWDI